ncbi:hypothetical protein OCF84_20870 (plasmid) [Shewanella xiamenensis]|uniref:Uncharacterized protein n=1 Tax=Shewanella xiamenensis TaxID=332186 RepID=A0ABT6UFN2_9GAMM|nr:hypothetical protein [Shewanella xiamenensis]MDI5833278.1 hypothetical protein [Shewanella xiamenensis]WHF57972.1 hypothetical protein OCF84_20870 [Shewanella xiamenensis]
MSTQSKVGRPKKLVTTRIYLSADTEDEHNFIIALMKRKELDPSFNIGAYLLEMTMKAVQNPPNGVLSLSDESLDKLTSSVLSGIRQQLTDLNILSNLTRIVNVGDNGQDNKIDSKATPISQLPQQDKLSMSLDHDDQDEQEAPVDEGIISLKAKGAFF